MLFSVCPPDSLGIPRLKKEQVEPFIRILTAV
jgi:hypothetical protein